MRRATSCVLVLLLLVPIAGRAQSGAAGKPLADDPRVAAALELIEVWVEAQVAYEDLPGVSMGVVYDQELVWSEGFGYADIESGKPARPDTIYSICSISKLFTSIGALQLRDAGKLSLDEPVFTYLPWFDIQDVHPEGPDITMRRILTHSAGLPREADFPYWTGPEHQFPTREQIIEKLSSQKTLYESAEYYQYSNLGLTLAGEVVAAASGQPYGEYIQSHILDPLELDSTTPEIPDDERGKRLATGYSRKLRDGSRKVVPDYLVRGIAPAAGFASTVEDLAKFASWQFRVLSGEDSDVLSRNTLREMQRVHWMDEDFGATRGLGFSVSRRDGTTFVGHGGSCPGYRTQLTMSAKDKVAVIFMTNGQGTSTGLYTGGGFDVVAPAIAAAVESPDDAEKADPALQKYVGRYERPLGGESYAFIWKGKLAMVSLPTENPLGSLTKLKHIEGDTFRRIRDDGELGEEFFFEVGPDGEVTTVWRNSNPSYRVRR